MDETTGTPTPELLTAEQLATELRALRLKLRMAWPLFAILMQQKMSSLYKLAQGETTRPHETTRVALTQRLTQVRDLSAEQAKREAERLRDATAA